MLAIRIKPSLTYIINEDQKGFLSNRRIHCNIRRMMDIVEHFNDCDEEPAAILQIYFRKCFDRIEISTLIEALKYFGFGETFIQWVKIIYNNAVSCVVNNGNFTNWISITRSVKQGGPCSAYFFLILAEVLAIELRESDIKGVKIHSILKLLGQYADNIDLYLWGEKNNITNALKKIAEFEKHSGFQINYNKTALYKIGSLRKSDPKWYSKFNIDENVNQINVLGVDICEDKKKMIRINYENLTNKAQSICKCVNCLAFCLQNVCSRQNSYRKCQKVKSNNRKIYLEQQKSQDKSENVASQTIRRRARISELRIKR